MKLSRSNAYRIAKKVADELGPGWKHHVFENIGWHVEWRNGSVNVFYSPNIFGEDPYWAMVGDEHGSGHISLTDHTPHFNSPRRAALYAIEEASRLYWKNIAPLLQRAATVKEDLYKYTTVGNATPVTKEGCE